MWFCTDIDFIHMQGIFRFPQNIVDIKQCVIEDLAWHMKSRRFILVSAEISYYRYSSIE